MAPRLVVCAFLPCRKVCTVMMQAHVIALHTLQNIPDQNHNWNVTERPCNEYYICINCAQFRYTVLFVFRKDNVAFREAVTKLEQNQICQGLPIQSFLTLPMQRITRLPLLVDAVCHRMDPSSQEYENATRTLQNLQKVWKLLELMKYICNYFKST